jgi:glycosyltransferase involved in cell wall biosynthesis
MRVCFDGSCLVNRRGFGRVAHQLLAALAEADHAHEVFVVVDRPSESRLTIPSRFQKLIADVAEPPAKAASATGRRSLTDMLAMGRCVARAKLDLIYFPASYSFFPVWNVPRVVVTMHDMLALTHAHLVFPTWQGRLAWRLKEHFAALWATRIVTPSQASRRDLVSVFNLPDRKINMMTLGTHSHFRVVSDGPLSDSVLTKYGVRPGSRYLIYVGGLSPHKNLPRLIEAFAQGASPETNLVIVGDMGDVFHTHVPVLREAVARNGLGDRVNFTGFVPDDDLVYLYNRAYACVQPSLMEGFGLPPAEAMACGIPVLASTAGSLPEVVGDAGAFFDPTDVPAMAKAIERLLADPAERDRLAAVALKRCSLFTWTLAAEQLLDCFDEIDPSGMVRGRRPAGAPHTSRARAGEHASR